MLFWRRTWGATTPPCPLWKSVTRWPHPARPEGPPSLNQGRGERKPLPRGGNALLSTRRSRCAPGPRSGPVFTLLLFREPHGHENFGQFSCLARTLFGMLALGQVHPSENDVFYLAPRQSLEDAVEAKQPEPSHPDCPSVQVNRLGGRRAGEGRLGWADCPQVTILLPSASWETSDAPFITPRTPPPRQKKKKMLKISTKKNSQAKLVSFGKIHTMCQTFETL